LNTVIATSRSEGLFQIQFQHDSGLPILSVSVLQHLDNLLDVLLAEPSFEVLVIGTSCAGANLKEIGTFESDDLRAAQEFSQLGQRITRKIESFPRITVALLKGPTFGGGVELSLACDFRYATYDAFLKYQAIKLGIVPCWGGTQRLKRLVGVSVAKRMLLGCESLTAEIAHHWGLVDKLFTNQIDLIMALKSLMNYDKTTLSQLRTLIHSDMMDYELEQTLFLEGIKQGQTQQLIQDWFKN
jgi:enoyl-CoA hydratase